MKGEALGVSEANTASGASAPRASAEAVLCGAVAVAEVVSGLTASERSERAGARVTNGNPTRF